MVIKKERELSGKESWASQGDCEIVQINRGSANT